jgi:flagellar biosynthesis GTPase FlhF
VAFLQPSTQRAFLAYYTDMEKEWLELGRTAANKTLTVLKKLLELLKLKMMREKGKGRVGGGGGGGVECWGGWREGSEEGEEEKEEEDEVETEAEKRGDTPARKRERALYSFPYASSLSPALQDWITGLFRYDDTRRARSTNIQYFSHLRTFWRRFEEALPPSLPLSLPLFTPRELRRWLLDASNVQATFVSVTEEGKRERRAVHEQKAVTALLSSLGLRLTRAGEGEKQIVRLSKEEWKQRVETRKMTKGKGKEPEEEGRRDEQEQEEHQEVQQQQHELEEEEQQLSQQKRTQEKKRKREDEEDEEDRGQSSASPPAPTTPPTIALPPPGQSAAAGAKGEGTVAAVAAEDGAAAGAAAPVAAVAGSNLRVFGPRLVLPSALQLLHDLLTEHKQQQQERPPASVSQAPKDVLRKGRELVCSLDERVKTFMDQLLATPGVVLTGEGGGDEERALRKRQSVRAVREYLKMVEKGEFAQLAGGAGRREKEVREGMKISYDGGDE